MTTEYIISEELATKVCAILINYGENRVANKLCSRPTPLTQDDTGNCLVICQHCGKVTQVQCKKDGD